jgi:hypothetical protein
MNDLENCERMTRINGFLFLDLDFEEKELRDILIWARRWFSHVMAVGKKRGIR